MPCPTSSRYRPPPLLLTGYARNMGLEWAPMAPVTGSDGCETRFVDVVGMEHEPSIAEL